MDNVRKYSDSRERELEPGAPVAKQYSPQSDGRGEPEPRERLVQPGNQDKLGIALVGLGKYSEQQLGPALKETSLCHLAGIVTGSPGKAEKWRRTYDIPEKNVYNYENFDSIKDNHDIDIVYVVLPNAMHSEFVIRAAKAGKHVICEKPMAITVSECDQMIDACKKANRYLSIGYRLHFEPHNCEMMRIGLEKLCGPTKRIVAHNGMSEASGWRLDAKLAGGGPLMDVGIYCVQAACYTTGMEPVSVVAKEEKKRHPEKYKNMEESLSWQMEFPDGLIADCFTSYSKDVNLLRLEQEKGISELSPAYAYNGIKGKTPDGTMRIPNVNQQARQMDDFAMCITSNRDTQVPGEMGRRDVAILQAIYESMRSGEKVTIRY